MAQTSGLWSQGGRRTRKWDRLRNPLLSEVDFWVPEDAAKTALDRGVEGTALVLSAPVKVDTADDSDQEETLAYSSLINR